MLADCLLISVENIRDVFVRSSARRRFDVCRKTTELSQRSPNLPQLNIPFFGRSILPESLPLDLTSIPADLGEKMTMHYSTVTVRSLNPTHSIDAWPVLYGLSKAVDRGFPWA